MMSEKRTAPELRFSEFLDVWRNRKIGDYFKNLRTGMTPSRGKPKYFSGKTPWITSGELNYNIIKETKERISDEAVSNTGLKLYAANTFFIAITGLEAPGTRGRCAINGLPSTTNQSCMAFEEVPEVNQRFLYYWYLRNGVRLYFKFAQGTKQESFNNRIVEDFIFIVPSLQEQQKIASFLTAVDRRIELLAQKKEKLERYKKGVMQQIFTQNIRFKQGDGSDFPDWEEKKLREVAKFSKGKGISKVDISAEGNLECIRYGELYTEYAEVIDEVKSRTKIDKKTLVLSQANDVIIPSSGETQLDIARAACVLRSGVALGGDLNIIRSSLNGVFLSFYLNHRRKHQIAQMAQGISVVHLYNSQLENLNIEIPSLEEQEKIVRYLVSLDNSIENLKKQINHTQTWKKGLLQKMFV